MGKMRCPIGKVRCPKILESRTSVAGARDASRSLNSLRQPDRALLQHPHVSAVELPMSRPLDAETLRGNDLEDHTKQLCRSVAAQRRTMLEQSLSRQDVALRRCERDEPEVFIVVPDRCAPDKQLGRKAGLSDALLEIGHDH